MKFIILLTLPVLTFGFSFNEKEFKRIKEKYKKGIDQAIEDPSSIKSYLYRKNIQPFQEIPDIIDLEEIKKYINKNKFQSPNKPLLPRK